MSWQLLPLVLRVKCDGWPALWLPVVLLWPVIILAYCLALPLCLLVPAQGRSALGALWASYRVLCATHGTELKIERWSFALY